MVNDLRIIAVTGFVLVLACSAVPVVAADRPPAMIDDLAWIAGHWRSTEGEAVSEEAWLAPLGGVMLGVHRDVLPTRGAFFEYLRIEERGGSLVYVASPLGRGATEFFLVEQCGPSVVFSNPGHDFPQRIAYTREGDRLTATVEGEMDGELRFEQWVWELLP